jgi:hypothetical protein
MKDEVSVYNSEESCKLSASRTLLKAMEGNNIAYEVQYKKYSPRTNTSNGPEY